MLDYLFLLVECIFLFLMVYCAYNIKLNNLHIKFTLRLFMDLILDINVLIIYTILEILHIDIEFCVKINKIKIAYGFMQFI